MLPGVLVFIAMLGRYPEIQSAPIPLSVLLDALHQGWLSIVMQIAIFGTLVQTGIGVLHGFNERLCGAQQAYTPALHRWRRVAVTVALCLIAIVLAAQIGLIDLIARGYGYLAWAVLENLCTGAQDFAMATSRALHFSQLQFPNVREVACAELP